VVVSVAIGCWVGDERSVTLQLLAPSWRDLWQGHSLDTSVGAIYTRPEIVDFILDLAGYSEDRGSLAAVRVLEPSCGRGAFVTRILGRLIRSHLNDPTAKRWSDPRLDGAIRAIDLDVRNLDLARTDALHALLAAGCDEARAASLCSLWFLQGDTLLTSWKQRFDLVAGNPPYVRIEDLPRAVLAAYRNAFDTLGDRADVYVAFLELGLSLLSERGTLAYITANRFSRNLYGRRLRRYIADRYHVRAFVNMEHTQPFEKSVMAYPCVVVVDRERGEPTASVSLSDLRQETLREVCECVQQRCASGVVHLAARWHDDGGPWVETSRAHVAAFDRLASLPLLEESAMSTRVGIGIATGADAVFILPVRSVEIEASCQVPLVMVGDIRNDGIQWSGSVLLDPFADADDGTLVNLETHPGLRDYLMRNEPALRARHVARTRPVNWYRTIDRIWKRVRATPKLLIPDIQSPSATIVGYDEGGYQPHHNVYTVVSQGWNLRALQTILRSAIVRQQVLAWSVQMRGGGIRWQAQTLRRVRVPGVDSLRLETLEALSELAMSSDLAAIDRAVDAAYDEATSASR
jgi:methylase of polypeptide subunit release factors